MGKSTISMAIFNSYVKLPEGNLWVLSPEDGDSKAPKAPSESSFATNDLHGVGGHGAAFQHKPRR